VTWSASERCKHRPARGNACVLGISIMGLIDPCLKRSSVLSGGKCPRLEARWEDQQTGGLPLWLPRRSPEDDPDQTAGQTRAKRGRDPVHPIPSGLSRQSLAWLIRSTRNLAVPAFADAALPQIPTRRMHPSPSSGLSWCGSSQTPDSKLHSPPFPVPVPLCHFPLLKSPTSPEDQGQRNMNTLSHFKSATARKRNAAGVAV
jgi:hypothetical protein